MKLFRNCVILMICISVVCSLMTTSVFAGEDTDIRRIGYETLNEKQKVAYNQLKKGIAEGKTEIELKPSLDEADAVLAFRMVYTDCPEYFWLVHNYGYYTVSGKVTAFVPNYLDIRDQQAAVDAACEEILAGMPATADTDYEKALYLHDALAAWTDYDYYGNDYDQSAYSALVMRSTVCAGYSHAYQLLLNKVGISAWMIEGVAGASRINHAWNQVWINDMCVYTDVTWDDMGDHAIYDAFNLNLESISQEHMADSVFEAGMPACNHDLALVAQDETVCLVDSSMTGKKLASMATVLSKGDFRSATVRIKAKDDTVDLDALLDKVLQDYMKNTKCQQLTVTFTSADECILFAYKGLGGTYERLTDDIIRFNLTYRSANLPSQACDLMVGFYDKNGQMVSMNMVETYLNSGACNFVSNCDEDFAECRVFLLDPETGAPLAKVAELIDK